MFKKKTPQKITAEKVINKEEKKVGNKEDKHIYNILIYGVDKKGLILPEEVKQRNFKLIFESYDTKRRFDEFDCVIMFQGIFESFSWKYGSPLRERYLACEHDKDELDKRNNELALLAKKGGFTCFLLCDDFIDSGQRSNSYASTDLCKIWLNVDSFYRKNFDKRYTHLNIKRPEFDRFLERYGAACSYFQNYNDRIELRVIAELGSETVGLILWNRTFFVPALVQLPARPKGLAQQSQLESQGYKS